MNKSVINKIVSGLGVLALIGMVYMGVNGFKEVDVVSKPVPTKAKPVMDATWFNPDTGTKAVAESTKVLVNPQWFTYQLDPTDAAFGTDKFVQTNYVATGVTNPDTRPCSSNGQFCSVYAETVMVGGIARPDLSSGTDAHDALDSYENGDGDQTLIDEEAN